MRRLIGVALAAAVLAACASAPKAPVVEGPPQPAVWALRDADSTIYLYGTIHMRKQGASWGGPVAERALAEAGEVWTEVEIDPARDAEMAPIVARYGLDATRTLSSRLTPQRAKQLKTAAAEIGVPLANIEGMKPWLASLTFSIVPMMRAGYDPQHGVDRSVDRIAEATGKRMRWFETGEEQLRFLSGFDDDLQIAMLEDSLDEVGKGPAALTAMEAAWEVGNDAALAREMVAELKDDYPALYDVILTKRNAAWVEVLSRELEGSGVDFVAVGAAHLVGPDSVQAMFAARGVTVERVTPPAP
jgi:uncharacterized protein